MSPKKSQISINEKMVLQAITHMQTLPTLMNIAKYLAKKYKLNLEDVKMPLKIILNKAVKYNILVNDRGTYYENDSEDSEDSDDSYEECDCENCRRRQRMEAKKRKSRSRSRSKGRKRSKSRSSRRKGRSRS